MWGVLWSRAPYIIAFVALVTCAAYVLTSLATDVYRATARVRVVDPAATTFFGAANGGAVRSSGDETATQLEFLRSRDLRDAVEEQLGSEADQVRSFQFSAVGETDFIRITATSASPQVAQVAANTYAETFVSQRQEALTAAFTQSASELRDAAAGIDDQIAALDEQLSNRDLSASEGDVLRSQRTSLVAQQADLRERATQFEVEATGRTGSVELADSARVPGSPFSPTPARNAAAAGLIALVFSVGVAFLLDRLDDRIKDPNDIERASGGAPLLGSIPIHGGGKRGAKRMPNGARRELVPLSSPSAEAYRTLRTSLRFSSIDKRRTTIVVTSSDQAEGKSTVTANLAVVLAESGLRVVLISADLRRPSISAMFGIVDTERGLTTVLLGDAPINECLQRVQTKSGQTLYVLPSGPLPQNPAELLGSKGMRDVVTTIEEAGVDYILIDTPPVLPVSDAMAISQFADGVLVVCVADHTKRAHLAQTADRLRRVNADIVGVVVNGVPTRKSYGYYGGYGYGYGANGYLPTADAVASDSSSVHGPVRLPFTSQRETDQRESAVHATRQPEHAEANPPVSRSIGEPAPTQVSAGPGQPRSG